jgi:hypothetical protein
MLRQTETHLTTANIERAFEIFRKSIRPTFRFGVTIACADRAAEFVSAATETRPAIAARTL